MMFVKKKLVTVICESQLEKTLIEDFHKLGVRGYTICEARGEGGHGLRAGDWEQNRNIRIEIVCGENEGRRIMLRLREAYYEDYAVIAFMSAVDVMRDDKFV